MSELTTQEPPVKIEAQAPTESATPPAPADLTPAAVEQLFQARRSGASPEELSLLQAGLLTKPEPAEPPAAVEPATPPEPTPAPVIEPPAGDTPPVEDEPAKVSDRPRITHLSEEDKINANAINLLTRKGLSLAEASARILGPIGTQPAEATPPAPAIPEVPAAVQAIDAEIASHEADLAKIKEDRKAYSADPSAFGEELAELDAKRNDILEAIARAGIKRVATEYSERQAVQTQEQAQAARQQALVDVAKVYPDLADKHSPFWAVTAAIANEIRDPAHPDHARSFEPDAVRYCAEEAAKRLGTTPASVAIPAKPAPAAIAPKPPGPARGSLATAPPPPPVSAEAAKQRAEQQFFARRNAGAGASSRAEGLISR